jgi:cell wall-associated NlpC family hydrolase
MIQHKVKSGETLYSIAHKNHTSIEEVRKVNHLKRGVVLKVGKVLKVPTNTYFPNQKMIKHTVKYGETLYTIAHAHQTTIKEVKKLNHLKRNSILKIGQRLTVRSNTYISKTAKKKQPKTHRLATKKLKIKRGDTLYSLSRKYHVSVSDIKKINGLKKSNMLKVGMSLKVPTLHSSKKRRIVKRTSTSNKKLVKSLERYETIVLKPRNQLSKKEKSFFSFSNIFSSSGADKGEKITTLAKKKLGRRYVWGAVGKKNTFDCSGLTTYVFKKNGIILPRRAIAQSKVGKYVKREDLREGDLIFFDTSKGRKGYVNHVGIYIGNNQFIHASSAKKKVVITSLNKRFYSERYRGARRLA